MAALVSGAYAATGSASVKPTPPFTLTWTQGTCRNCKTADKLVDVQFVSTNEAWAIGYVPPGGEAGAGDYAALHSRDGGKSWTEILEPWQHNEGPSISFANANEGWLRDVDIVNAETRLLETSDGGAHWRRLPMRDLFVKGVQYLGGGSGYGTGYDVYSKQGYLIATSDHGRHWNQSLLPRGFSPGLMQFSGHQHGVVAGCLDRRLAVIRTADGGQHWAVTSLDQPRATPKVFTFCDCEPDSLDFLDAQHGWLLTSKHSFGLHDDKGVAVAWSTTDGGANWKPIYRATFRAGNEQFRDLHFIDARLGFISLFRWSKDENDGLIYFTADGGEHWNQMKLPHVVWGCQRFGDGLECAAGDNGFWVLRISRAAQPRK